MIRNEALSAALARRAPLRRRICPTERISSILNGFNGVE